MAENSLSLPRPPPDHPPYAEMISKAILMLEEEGGSTADSIDVFIQSEYEDLPPAHCNLFPYHLAKLVRLGELQQPTPNTYIVTPDNALNPFLLKPPSPTPTPTPVKKRKRPGRPPKQKPQDHGEDASVLLPRRRGCLPGEVVPNETGTASVL